ncbi:murein L,D-transpeptidase catalytic domain-containing protein [Flavihumibacter solisilvae]|uniref:Peptidase n=1 Tax=Flavihumibacter solisilvae TaxID=1349421 RepID=A0A0C1LLA3_9BACT|nr:murein L,D-transpeptidase catalytic domain family protein [Flavihumibacter solisilvae]KIC96123.1 hypothetical protein OI18_02865 [Flavihumibacter solisilvae]
MKVIKGLTLLIICLVLIPAALAVHFAPAGGEPEHTVSAATFDRLKRQSADLLSYTSRYNYNSYYCFMVDMSLPSGKNRFFIYDLRKDSIRAAGLTSHGCCGEAFLTGRKFSNGKGSKCSSLGKYMIGQSYIGKFGRAYRLHGLENSNSNAYERYVVLHAFECIPDREIHPYQLCQSDGCPTVSHPMFRRLDSLLKSSTRPVLLQIFE